MALSRETKEALLQEYSERLGRAQVMIWAQYGGLSVKQAEALRRRLREVGAETMVVKNTLMELALKQANLPATEELVNGPRMVTFIYNNEIASATKALVDFIRENGELMSIRGGIVGGRLATPEQVQSLTNLPSYEVLLAQVVGGIQAPISGLVNTLA
ncbi:MAG: 50S ribosomal protein L10, partial [Chloroflexi bacterium]|nr:50S ribosomal protein L10 [Chloroflexota bacterium]